MKGGHPADFAEARHLWTLYLEAVGERYGLGHAPKNFIGSVEEKHWPCFERAFLKFAALKATP